MANTIREAPLTYRLASWYGIGLAGCYLLYGGVKIILGILDRNYSDLGNPIFFAIVGVILSGIVFGFIDARKWGWYGLIGVNGLIVISALIGYSEYLNLILLVLSGAAIYFLTAEPTRNHLASRQ
ncbi:MAG: hypothetical protein P1R58_02990 [bacterium]|nr:hypothetical protein [bacterium]